MSLHLCDNKTNYIQNIEILKYRIYKQHCLYVSNTSRRRMECVVNELAQLLIINLILLGLAFIELMFSKCIKALLW